MVDLERMRARIIAEECPPSPARWRAYRLLLRGLRMMAALSVLTGCAVPRHAQAQFIGYTASQTVQPPQIFTNQAANGSSVALTNLGTSTHLLSYCTTGFAGTISLEASPDGTFSSPIPMASAAFGQRGLTDTACHVLQAGGYFPAVRARVSNYVSGSVNAWYSAVGAPIAFSPSGLGSNGPTAPIVCDNFVFASIAPSSTVSLVSLLPGTVIYVCQMTVSFNGATTAGLLTLGGATSGGGCPSYVANWEATITANTPQLFQVGGPFGAFLQEGGPGGANQLCATTGALSATAVVSFSFAQR